MLRSYCKQDALVVALDGELDHFCAQSIRRQLDEMLADPSVRYLVLDFDKLTFMDSSGIALIMKTRQWMHQTGGRAQVENPASQPLRVLDASGIDRFITVKGERRQ